MNQPAIFLTHYAVDQFYSLKKCRNTEDVLDTFARTDYLPPQTTFQSPSNLTKILINSDDPVHYYLMISHHSHLHLIKNCKNSLVQ